MSLIDTIRRPEHTGADRCRPCTAVNAVAVLLASLVAALVSGPFALVVLAGGAALVYLRGYVVPGTPTFAPRLVAALGLAPLFAHAPDGDGSPSERAEHASEELAASADPEEQLGTLFAAGVLEERDDGALRLTESFAAAWREELAALRDLDDDALADATAAVAPFDAEGEPRFDGVGLEGDGRGVWLSRTNARGDAAAVRAMGTAGVPEPVRAPAAAPLRLFTPECPDCGGPLAETTLAPGCCGGTMGAYDSPEREALACEDCDAVVHRLDAAADEADDAPPADG